MKFGTLLTLPRLALSTSATALRLLAAVNEALAERITGATGAYRDPVSSTAPRSAQQPSRTLASAATTAQAEPAASESVDISELVTRNAPQVIAALAGLSSTELADLYELESRRRRRTTVLAAIEAAAAPPPYTRDDEVLLVDDVREPDVLVYSTASAKRSGD